MLPSFFDSALQLIVRTSTDLPPDVRAAMNTSLDAEPAGTRASQALTIIAQNIDLARLRRDRRPAFVTSRIRESVSGATVCEERRAGIGPAPRGDRRVMTAPAVTVAV